MEYDVSYELEIQMYNAIIGLGKKYNALLEEYKKNSASASIDEMNKLSIEANEVVNNFRGLKNLYLEYLDKPSKELEDTIIKTYGKLISEDTDLLDKKVDEESMPELAQKPVLDEISFDFDSKSESASKESMPELAQKPVLDEISFDSVLSESKSESVSRLEKPVLDGMSFDDLLKNIGNEESKKEQIKPALVEDEKKSVDEFCEEYGYRIINPIGFDSKELAPTYKMTRSEFFDKLKSCAFDYVDLEKNIKL